MYPKNQYCAKRYLTPFKEVIRGKGYPIFLTSFSKLSGFSARFLVFER